MAAWEPLVLAAFGRFTRGSDETAASLAALKTLRLRRRSTLALSEPRTEAGIRNEFRPE